ncbi:MAG: alpha-amylase family glycosyl hydrolase [Termitinemataceae bacterium]|nr:MAG: alpha-amylase family glycosyl hydrolase [Termitinemataceae bacterium]
MPEWLNNAIFYEIYPQSFLDTNGDGIGDFEGIIQKLDYINGLGCNALWLNPCFDSPFKDAGYDVRDYKKTAPRYGTNDDLKRLFSEAHKRKMRVLLDLVPGHTSEEHQWFIESSKACPKEYRDRYIWTDHCFKTTQGIGFIAGEAERAAAYIINFFKCQPALNYGWFKPAENWQLPMDHPGPAATREALKDIMRFWLDAGCDGFRVDMAMSLVKGDDGERSGTSMLWRDIRAMLDRDYPDAAIVSEWSYPKQAIAAGFHADFFLDFAPNSGGFKSLFRDYELTSDNVISGEDKSFFKKGAKHNIKKFVDEYIYHYEATKHYGYISLVTGNHDIVRMRGSLSTEEIALAYAFIFTMPGVPFLYYGDEIGMRYINVPTKEGGYYRTGSRTPMQWKAGANLGFSAAAADKLYLPVDGAADAPTVEAQEKDPASLLNKVKALIALRRAEKDLGALPNFSVIYAESGRMPFVYRRGSLLVAVNPSGECAKAAVPQTIAESPLYAIGNCSAANGECSMDAQSFGVWRLAQ